MEKHSRVSEVPSSKTGLTAQGVKPVLKISKTIAKHLKKSKIFFAGIDLISNYLIGDINVTSPTGLKNFKDLSGVNLAEDFWNNLEKLK